MVSIYVSGGTGMRRNELQPYWDYDHQTQVIRL